MTFPEDAGGTFEGRLGCPSELVLDRYVVGELSAPSRAELDAHLAGCEVCRHRLELRTSGAGPLRQGSAARIAVARALASEPEQAGQAVDFRAGGRLRRNAWLLWIPICAALGAAAVWLLRR